MIQWGETMALGTPGSADDNIDSPRLSRQRSDSIQREWQMVRYALHLPPLDQLEAREVEVVSRIEGIVQGTRSRVLNVIGQDVLDLPPEAGDHYENRAEALAASLLDYLKMNMDETQMDALLNQHREVELLQFLQIPNVRINGQDNDLEIRNGMWLENSEEEMVDEWRRSPLAVFQSMNWADFDVAGANDITEPMIREVMNILRHADNASIEAQIEHPQARQSARVHVPGYPENMYVDVHVQVIAGDPSAAVRGALRDVTMLGTLLSSELALNPGSRRFMTVHNEDAVGFGALGGGQVATQLYRQFGKANHEHLTEERISLGDLERRQEVFHRLNEQDASSYEKLLAMGMLRRDNHAADVILNPQGANVPQLRADMEEQERRMHIANAIVDLNNRASFTLEGARGGIATMQIVEGLSSSGNSAINIQQAVTAGGGNTAYLAAQGIPATIPGTKNNAQQLADAQSRARAGRQQYEEARDRILGQIRNVQWSQAELSRRGITPVQLTQAQYPTLHALFVQDGIDAWRVDEDDIAEAIARTNPTSMRAEMERALAVLPANADDQIAILQDSSHYSAEYQRLRSELSTALSSSTTPLEGSAACWAIIRHGLERSGMRRREVQETIVQLQSRSDQNADTQQLRQDMAEEDVPDESKADNDLHQEWNNGKRVAISGPRRLGNWVSEYRADPWLHYRDNLFRTGRDAIGMTINQNPKTVGTRDLERSYFMAKHLYDLPAEDPRRLPHVHEVRMFLRRCHAELAKRYAEGVMTATGTSVESLRGTDSEDMGETVNRLPGIRERKLRENPNKAKYAEQAEAIANRIQSETMSVGKEKWWYQRNITKPAMAIARRVSPKGAAAMSATGTAIRSNAGDAAKGAAVGGGVMGLTAASSIIAGAPVAAALAPVLVAAGIGAGIFVLARKIRQSQSS